MLFYVHFGVAKPAIPAFLRGFVQPGRRITAFLRAFLGLHVEETRENAGKALPGVYLMEAVLSPECRVRPARTGSGLNPPRKRVFDVYEEPLPPLRVAGVLVGWWAGGLVGWWAGWLVGWLAGRLVGW